MAQQQTRLDQERISCSICLDFLRDPVAIPCGHSYCQSCIQSFWDEEDQKKIHSCPRCRETFTLRPVPVKNTMLADLVEELRKTGLYAAPGDHCCAGSEDVACDLCTGRKLKAVKSCLICMASYCKKHLQPHYDAAPLKKHKLAEPSKKLQENICPHHAEVMKMFCRTDQQCICYLCSVEQHKGHDTVSAAAERAERQKALEESWQQIQKRIQDGHNEMKELQHEVEDTNHAADKAVADSEKIFTRLIRLIKKRNSEVKQQIRSRQKTKVSRLKELQETLEQEIADLTRQDADMDHLSCTDDHIYFLQNYPSLSHLSELTDSSSIKIHPWKHFEDMVAAVSKVRDELQIILRDKWMKSSQTETEVDVLLPDPEPKTRADFLKYSCEITLDPNTANRELSLSEGNTKVTWGSREPFCCDHPDRFTGCVQVLSRESLTGRHYWEVKWSGEGVYVAVAYKNIKRSGPWNECGFGCNEKSWALDHFGNNYSFTHNNIYTPVSGPQSSTIGVYLDHSAGNLSFYSVSETMTLLHRVQTTFTQPLYAGLWFYSFGDSVELCKLK